jgi:hypothetical protein
MRNGAVPSSILRCDLGDDGTRAIASALAENANLALAE